MPRSFLVRKSSGPRRKPNYSELQDSSLEFTFQQPYDQAHLLAAIPPPEVLNPSASLPMLIWDSLLAPQVQPVGWASLQPQEGPKAAELTSLSDEDSGKGSQPPSPPSPASSSFSSTSASSLEAEAYAAFPGLGQLPKQLAQLSMAKDSQSRKAFNCKYCNKEYLSLGALKMHIRSHTLPCVCGTCGKAFSRPWLLQGHVRTHTAQMTVVTAFGHRRCRALSTHLCDGISTTSYLLSPANACEWGVNCPILQMRKSRRREARRAQWETQAFDTGAM
ncbi:zinc finger protein SNAI1 isoform X1 [Tupaia chinensis]|uniref:zinc finger protein SNAI1 isoform X1 n=1 Tax=Tupaia chinensis TaxID=246437 RepID=UPI000FFC7076|nr:zinc finger protein SNAI1 isoform X1 [Tupaia chinensis]